jgi:hypothetical protein
VAIAGFAGAVPQVRLGLTSIGLEFITIEGVVFVGGAVGLLQGLYDKMGRSRGLSAGRIKGSVQMPVSKGFQNCSGPCTR